METPFLTILIAVPSAAFTALAMWLIAQRRIEVKNITQERAKWRKQVRKLHLKVHDALPRNPDSEKKLGRLRSEFTALLNPLDPKDCEILECITGRGSRQEQEQRTSDFDSRISLLLKHDKAVRPLTP